MFGPASQLSQRLSANAEAVCRAYLPKGRRSGAYWTCGDVSRNARAEPLCQAFGRSRGADGKTRDLGSTATFSTSSALTKDTQACAIRSPRPGASCASLSQARPHS